MRSSNFNALCFIVLILLNLTACNPKSAEIAPTTVKHEKHEKHLKPGADVKFQSHSIIFVKGGEIVNTDLVLTTNERSGRLLLDLSVSEGLELLDTPKQIDAELSETKLVKIPVKLRAIRDGRFYLYLQASLSNGESTSSRSLALIVQAGPEIQQETQFQKPAGENLISMPAQETHSTP